MFTFICFEELTRNLAKQTAVSSKRNYAVVYESFCCFFAYKLISFHTGRTASRWIFLAQNDPELKANPGFNVFQYLCFVEFKWNTKDQPKPLIVTKNLQIALEATSCIGPSIPMEGCLCKVHTVFFIAIYPKGCNISWMNNMKTERKKQNNEKQCGELPKPSWDETSLTCTYTETCNAAKDRKTS